MSLSTSGRALALRAGILAVAATVFVFSVNPAMGGGGPESVAVVVNADSWASLAVANEYINLRQIPACNVVYLGGLPGNLSIDVNQFRDLILKPVLKTLEQRGLVGQIDCIAYSADLPYSVGVQPDIGQQKLPRAITPEASINGLTYLYGLVLAKNVHYLSLTANHYFRRRTGTGRDEPLSPAEQEQLGKASRLMHEKKWTEAEPSLRQLAAAHPASSLLLYDLACCLARLGKNDEAMAAFQRAVDAGWLDVWHAQKDPDLASLRGRPEFKTLMEKLGAARFETQAPRAFHNAVGWSPGGEPTSPNLGMRYVLSTMLAMTSGRGNSVREAIQCLRRSVSADGTCPKGTIYYLQNGDIRSTTRQWGFRSAVDKLKSLGVAAEIVQGVLPPKRADVAGAMIGAAQFDWPKCASTILPGAICEHLTSCGGIMREAGGQTPISELLRYGAAGSSGTVTEPFAIQNKFPTPFLHVFYASGCTLAEAFYQSVQGPYQLLIVGDPLSRPWAKIPKVEIDGLESGAAVKGPLVVRPKTSDQPRIARSEIYLDGHRVGAIERLAPFGINTGGLPDGHHEVRLVVVAADPIETQGNAIVPVVVDNRGLSMEVAAPTGSVALDQPVTLRATMAQAKRIVFVQNGRELGAIGGSEGSLTIPAARLGLGRVKVQPVGILMDNPRPPSPPAPLPRAGEASREATPKAEKAQSPSLASAVYLGRPIELEIVAPKPLPAMAERPERLVPGLRLSSGNATSVVIERTRDRDWLTKAVKPGQDFTLEGYFEAPSDDVYQFQVRATIGVEVLVDSRPLPLPTGEGLKYLPVSLAVGMHKLTVKGRSADKASLELYFGGPGAPSLGADRFRCVKPPVVEKKGEPGP